MAVSGCMSLIAVSNVILLITGAVSLPLYFSFYGSEAAVRFSIFSSLYAFLPTCCSSKRFGKWPESGEQIFSGFDYLTIDSSSNFKATISVAILFFFSSAFHLYFCI